MKASTGKVEGNAVSAWSRSFLQWFDATAAERPVTSSDAERIDWLRCIPFFGMHAMCLAVFWVGFSWVGLAVAAGLYLSRMFFITGFYHRYFSHRSFKTTRAFQFVMALAGSLAAQRDPLWWAAHHRHHHAHSDQAEDPHSPGRKGFFWSHLGWFMTKANFLTKTQYVRDWLRFPELRLLARFDWAPPLALAASLFVMGGLFERHAPGLETNGMQLLVWGFFVSTVVLYHATYTINSVAHGFGRRRFATADDSRNNLTLALLTLGEGWHNNHHYYPAAARQGFYWWEVDLTYYLLVVLSWLGLIWDLRAVPEPVLQQGRA